MNKDFKTTHELAKYLLSKEDCPVKHHFYYHEDFDDHGMDWLHSVEVVYKGGEIHLTTGEFLEREDEG